MILLGYDIGSSSVKASLVDSQTGTTLASAFYPPQEAPIMSSKPGWAEQDPDMWWNYLSEATKSVLQQTEGSIDRQAIGAIGISYQMHGLVCVDKNQKVLRPSIIWCDSRAIPYGDKASDTLGYDFCMQHLLNTPGNFTAAKLAWVKENEPEVYSQIDKIMLPGDYIAMKLTGEITTTASGLSEGMFWDFTTNKPCTELLQFYGFDTSLLPEIKDTFSDQGHVMGSVADKLGIPAGIPVSYRAGDQPNNALSLGVVHPGQVAATAGTSGVVYGVNGVVKADAMNRVNNFAHVNHSAQNPRLGVLLCINGTGIQNAWAKRNLVPPTMGYTEMNELGAQSPIGAEGISVLPFGNGAERMLQNKEIGACIDGIQFNHHNQSHLVRAVQEGIVFALAYGIDVMKGIGMEVSRIHAGQANMFLSPIFRETLSGVTGATIDLFDTDGSVGAARGAGLGIGVYKSFEDAFETLKVLKTISPIESNRAAYHEAYSRWKELLEAKLRANN